MSKRGKKQGSDPEEESFESFVRGKLEDLCSDIEELRKDQTKPQPRSQGLLRFQDGGREKTLAHTVIPPAKYSTNRGVFCHVTHKIEFRFRYT